MNLCQGSIVGESQVGIVHIGDMLRCACCSATLRTINSSKLTRRTFAHETSRKRFVHVSSHASPKLSTICRAASAASALTVADTPVASIDVEFAHFLGSGKITTAAAEVCLLKDTGAVMLHSYICPGAL